MMKLTRSDRERINTILENVINGQDGIYIPRVVERSDKLTFEQKELYGLLCMQASSTGVVANGTHLVYILGGLTAEVTKDLERLKKLGYIAPVIKSIGFCKYEVTYWNILNIDDVEKVKRKMLKEG
ncbi:hypothetical protein [Ligilactobacillus animalis]|uniref:hypothetical protein n=2 Tax=Ligilactobacillus animalis TaxID=1605 RepID=UPI0026499412|nr:hypothetical protein [Ligilactobacillus animalis]WKB73110.1 hypothetical protein QYH52_02500 [Ligilactobacillus animalis]